MKTSKLLTSILGATALACASPAHAIVIDFETGYAAGVLSGQPSTPSATTWALTNGGTNVVNVATGIGVGGSQGITGITTGAGSNFVYYGFNTTNADLGTTFNSATSVLDYSFQWRPTQTLDAVSAVSIFNFTIGSNTNTATNGAMSLTIRSNGVLAALNSTTSETVSGLFTLNAYAIFSGQVNYATNTYTVFVDAAQQFTSISGGNLAFNNAASDNAFIRVGNLSAGNLSANYRTWNADNISVIPEPSTYALMGLGMLALAMFRRSRHRAC